MKKRLAGWRTTLLQRQSRLTAIWLLRSQRERLVLCAAAVLIFGVLAYVILINPALEGRSRTQQSLPELRIQAAQIRAMASEVAALPQLVAQPASLSQKELESILQQYGLKAKSIVISGNSVRLEFQETPFAPLLDSLGAFQKIAQLSVVDASFDAQDKVGSVNATLQLFRQMNE